MGRECPGAHLVTAISAMPAGEDLIRPGDVAMVNHGDHTIDVS